MTTAMTRQAREELAAARRALGLGSLTWLASGAGNWVYVSRKADGQAVAVKVRGSGRGRFGAAVWASKAAAVAGLAVPETFWFGDYVCVEQLCTGRPMDLMSLDNTPVTELAAVLQLLHAIPVCGFGRLDEAGRGELTSVYQWLLRTPPQPHPAPPGWSGLVTRVREQLAGHARLFDQVEPSLVHGDLRARHVILNEAGTLAGIIDWESARGGDPLADLAGWTLQEPSGAAHALMDAYFRGLDPGSTTLIRLTCYRLRIAMWLVAWHTRQGNDDLARLHLGHLNADMLDLAAGTPALLPGTSR